MPEHQHRAPSQVEDKPRDDQLADLHRQIDELREQAARSEALAKELDDLRAQRTEAQQIIAQMRKASAVSGALKGAALFKKDKQHYSLSASLWLTTGVTLSAVTIALIAMFIAAYAEGPFRDLRLVTEASPAAWSIQIATGKLLLVAFLAVLTLAALRNYRAARHNAVLSRHRLAAIELFESFSSSTSDSAVKSAIVLAAAQTVFGASPTGFDRAGPN
jgi:hypothetical protein